MSLTVIIPPTDVSPTTGSGNAVLATSPTLTTPISATLTAPAGIDLTLAGGTAGSDSVVVSNTLAASSAIIGAFKVGNGTAATNVAIGGGNVNAGGTGTFGGALTVTGNTSIGTNVFKIDTTNTRIVLGLAGALQGDTLEIAAKSNGGTISLFGRAGAANESIISFRANGAITQKAFIQGADEGLLLGTGSTTRLSIAASTGNVTLASTTAGASGAGALVVAGGISAGNTGSAASYFGGAVTATGGLTASSWSLLGAGVWPTTAMGQSGSRVVNSSATENQLFTILNMNTAASGAVGINYGASIYLGARGTDNTADMAIAEIFGARESATSGNLTSYLSFKTSNSIGARTEALRLASTGAATFAGAVAIGNTTAASVAAPSTHKVSILIGGVQYYLLASNV